MNIPIKKQGQKASPILARNANESLRILLRITQKLVDLADQETQYLITNDHMGFAYLQKDKACLAEHYAKASEEFRARLEEFRTADQRILAQLETLQNALKEKTQSNNTLIARIKDRAAANTKATLFTVQELGQRIQFSTDTKTQQKDGSA